MAPFGKLYTCDVCQSSYRLNACPRLPYDADFISQKNPRSTAIKAVAKANNIELEIIETDPAKGISPDYFKINKLGKIPTFVGADGYTLHESIAIAIYSTSISINELLNRCCDETIHSVIPVLTIRVDISN
jgi:elongation factor 1-gamma